jgi:translation initiation factor IF-3
MDLTTVISTLEKYLSNKSDMLILQTNSERCNIRAYKKYTYTLWKINKNTDSKTEVINIQNTKRAVTEQEDTDAIKAIEEEFLLKLFDYIRYHVDE